MSKKLPEWMIQGELLPEDRPTEPTTSNMGAARAWAFHMYDEMTWSKMMVAPGFRFEWINTEFSNFIDD